MSDLLTQFSGIQDQAKAQKTTAQPPLRAMGASRLFQAEADMTAAPNVSTYTVRGIDISHHQFTVDWIALKTSSLSFIYIKATEGAEGVDEDFAQNWAGAASAGLARGAYHFYSFCKTGSEQADNFIKTVPADAGVLPPTVDIEESGDCRTLPSKAAFRKDLAAFVAKIQSAYGRPPILYINYRMYDKYLKGENDSYKYWIADVNHAAPSLPSWTLWQYGWHGRVAGITDEVDLDVFNGTSEEFSALIGPSGLLVAQP